MKRKRKPSSRSRPHSIPWTLGWAIDCTTACTSDRTGSTGVGVRLFCTKNILHAPLCSLLLRKSYPHTRKKSVHAAQPSVQPATWPAAQRAQPKIDASVLGARASMPAKKRQTEKESEDMHEVSGTALRASSLSASLHRWRSSRRSSNRIF